MHGVNSGCNCACNAFSMLVSCNLDALNIFVQYIMRYSLVRIEAHGHGTGIKLQYCIEPFCF